MNDYKKFIFDLEKLISFASVKGKKTENAPFGVENKNALDYFLGVACRMGFETVNYDNYIGEIVFGQGEEVGIIGHLDVVPAGNGWDTDPFTLTEKDGNLYGRGVLDDKAGSFMALYALKELKDSAITTSRKFRLFVGCNEESGWKDVEYLKTKTTLPKYGFSPDGNFPLSYAEKGMYEIAFTFPKLKNFSQIKGGTVVNAVCAQCSCVASEKGVNLSLVKKHGLVLKGDNVIESLGKSAHGSTPKLGKNALFNLFDYFLEMGEDVRDICDYITGDKLNLFGLSNEQGTVTFSPDLIEEKDGEIVITADCRIPAPFTIETVTKILDTAGLKYKVVERHPPVVVEKKGWFVQALLSAYNEVTGENAEPISMGGSTFARAFNLGCAFGPCFLGSDNCCHEPNEHVSIKDLKKSYEIYKTAIFNLAKVEK